MDPGPPKSTSKPVPLGPTDTANTRGTLVEPFTDRPAVSDSYLLPPLMPDEIGRLGRYRVLAELGRGGMGAVYRAEDPTLERVVALKVLLPELAADPTARERFVREAKAQAKVEHDHIIAIHAVEESAGVAFIVMPLLKGTSLAATLKVRPRPPLASLVRIGKEIAEGLAAAHAVGLIHRDIKPANVWLETKGTGVRGEGSEDPTSVPSPLTPHPFRVKILDFGVAQTVAPGGGRHTASGAVVGSPAYMSPEQAHGRPVDPRTDLFALGVLLYEMATGGRPFTGPSVMDVLAAVVAHDPPPAAEANPDVPRPLSGLIARLMAKEPAGRPATAAAAARELDAIGRALVAPVPVVVTAAAGASNPWAELDSTSPEGAADDEDDEGATIATRAAPPAPLTRRWVWPAVAGGVVAALVVGGLLVARPWKGKSRDDTALAEPQTQPGRPGPRPQPQQPPPVVSQPVTPPVPVLKGDDRKVAEWVLGGGGHGESEVRIRRDGLDKAYFPGDVPLPDGPFELVAVVLNFNSQLTDADLANLTGCAKLEYLSFIGTPITDAGLKHLRGLTALTDLNLSYTRVTPRGFADLRCERVKAPVVEGVVFGNDLAVLADAFPAATFARVTAAGVTGSGVKDFERRLPKCVLQQDEMIRPKTGLAFDGQSAFVEIPRLEFDGKLPLTIEAWVTPDTVDGVVRQIFLFGPPGGGIGVGGKGRTFGAGLKTTAGWENDYARDAVTPKQMVHLAAVLTAKQFTLYIDGKPAGVKDVALSRLSATEAPAVIGKHIPNTPEGYFSGTIHGVRVSRIARYERAFIPPPPSVWLPDADTIALYRCDDDKEEKLTDSSGNGWHGVIRGARRVEMK